MKLVRQVRLGYQEGRSDKVYEVDLCEVGDDRYVVNFRYGRRGASLRDGSKTTLPVSRDEAERIFAKLVDSKVKKGYRDEGEGTSSEPSAPKQTAQPAPNEIPDGLKKTVLDRIRAGTHSESDWPLERAIWRAGELRLREATPHLLELVGSANDMREYCIAWALARCGDDTAIAHLARLHTSSEYSDAVCRIAGEGLLALGSGEALERFLSQVASQIPAEIRQAADESPDALADALQSHLADAPPEASIVLEHLYLLSRDEGTMRRGLVKILETAPLAPNTFSRLRHIFKAAELRDDAEVYGLLAYRFEKTKPNFNRGWGVYLEGRWIQDVNKELAKKDSRLAFSKATREYLRRRSWRHLRRRGEVGDESYVRMAVGLLLPFGDEDREPSRQAYSWTSQGTVHYDSFARYLAFNKILYGNSPRYEMNPSGKAFRCKGSFTPGQAAPAVREESFPELWDREPRGLLHLLSDSGCKPVHEFAVKALETNTDFCEELGVDVLAMLLSRRFEVTMALGVRLAKKRAAVLSKNRDLTRALLAASLDEARQLGRDWVEASTSHFLEELEFVVSIVTARHSDVRQWAGSLLRTAFLPETTKKALVGRLIAYLLSLDDSEDHVAMAKEVGESLQKACGSQLRELGFDILRDLLAHPLAALDVVAGNILLDHRVSPSEIPGELLSGLIESKEAEARRIGIGLFGRLSDRDLLSQRDLLMTFALSPLEDVRESVRPVIGRLASSHPDFAKELSNELIPYLLRKEKHEGLHASLLPLLRDELQPAHPQIDQEITWWLLHASPQPANALGAHLLERNQKPSDFTMRQIVRLAANEIRRVREWAWQAYRDEKGRVKKELDQSVRLLDSPWEDTRGFAFDFFQRELSELDWTPSALVGICDSVRPDVQRFGRELVTRFFKEEAGSEYLAKLSQHPAADVQLFATNYLERYASDDPRRLEELEHYFTVVLSQIFRGRVAKDRVFRFLTREAEKSEQAAQTVATLLNRISATVAIGDKASCVEAMVEINRRYPQIELAIHPQAIEARASKYGRDMTGGGDAL